MNASCPHCHVEVRIDASRLPAGRAVRVACPGCRQTFPFGPVDAAAPAPEPVATPMASEPAACAGEIDERLVERVAERVMARLLPLLASASASGASASAAPARPDGVAPTDDDARRALVCDSDPAFAAQAAAALRELGYLPEVAPDLKTAWRLLDRPFAVVTVADALADDPQGGAKILDRLSRLPGAARRETFVAFVSAELRTGDGGLAFVTNANLTVSRADAGRLRDVLRKGLADRDKMYRPFLAALQSAQTAGH